MLTPSVFGEMGRIRAGSLREDAGGRGGGRRSPRRRGAIRRAIGVRLVNAGSRMMREVA
jgi:hypothetical protein